MKADQVTGQLTVGQLAPGPVTLHDHSSTEDK